MIKLSGCGSGFKGGTQIGPGVCPAQIVVQKINSSVRSGMVVMVTYVMAIARQRLLRNQTKPKRILDEFRGRLDAGHRRPARAVRLIGVLSSGRVESPFWER